MPEHTHVLSIDPGGTTGVSLVRIYDLELAQNHLITDPVELSKCIQHYGMHQYMDVFVVIEDFVGSGPRTPEAIHVLKLIGRIMATCEFVDLPYTLKTPQARIPLVTEARKRTARGTSPHIIASYAHALAMIEKGDYAITSSK